MFVINQNAKGLTLIFINLCMCLRAKTDINDCSYIEDVICSESVLAYDLNGRPENFYQLIRIEIFPTFLYITYVYNEILTRPNVIFTRLGRVDVEFFFYLWILS